MNVLLIFVVCVTKSIYFHFSLSLSLAGMRLSERVTRRAAIAVRMRSKPVARTRFLRRWLMCDGRDTCVTCVCVRACVSCVWLSPKFNVMREKSISWAHTLSMFCRFEETVSISSRLAGVQIRLEIESRIFPNDSASVRQVHRSCTLFYSLHGIRSTVRYMYVVRQSAGSVHH